MSKIEFLPIILFISIVFTFNAAAIFLALRLAKVPRTIFWRKMISSGSLRSLKIKRFNQFQMHYTLNIEIRKEKTPIIHHRDKYLTSSSWNTVSGDLMKILVFPYVTSPSSFWLFKIAWVPSLSDPRGLGQVSLQIIL